MEAKAENVKGHFFFVRHVVASKKCWAEWQAPPIRHLWQLGENCIFLLIKRLRWQFPMPPQPFSCDINHPPPPEHGKKQQSEIWEVF